MILYHLSIVDFGADFFSFFHKLCYRFFSCLFFKILANWSDGIRFLDCIQQTEKETPHACENLIRKWKIESISFSRLHGIHNYSRAFNTQHNRLEPCFDSGIRKAHVWSFHWVVKICWKTCSVLQFLSNSTKLNFHLAGCQIRQNMFEGKERGEKRHPF